MNINVGARMQSAFISYIIHCCNYDVRKGEGP